MKKITLILLSTILLPLVVGCAEDDPQRTPFEDTQPGKPAEPSKAPRENSRVEFKINGEDPETYFRYFLFGYTGACGQSLWYYKATSDRILLGKDALGRDILARVDLMMLAAGTLYGIYDEVSVVRYTPSGFESTAGNKKQIIGHWDVVQDKLILDGFGVASALRYNGSKAMSLVFNRDVISPGLKNRSTIITRVMSNNVGVDELDVCKR